MNLPRPARTAAALAALATLLALPGCATLSQDQCLSGDWREIGYQDGAHGRPHAQLAKHRQACGEYGVRPNVAAWEAGRRRGLRSYCTPHQGFIEGRQGRAYQGVCHGANEHAFLQQYRYGKAIHEAEEALEDTRREISSAESKLEANDTTAEQREALRDELGVLRDQLQHQRNHLLRLQHH